MPRLIDADALRATFSNMTIFGYGDYVSGQKMMLDTIIDYIDAAPPSTRKNTASGSALRTGCQMFTKRKADMKKPLLSRRTGKLSVQ